MTRITAVVLLAALCASTHAENKTNVSYQDSNFEFSNTSFCQSGPDLFNYAPFRDNVEAEKLAIVLSGQLRAPDEAYSRILRDLRLIRVMYPEIAFIVGARNYNLNNMIVRLIDGQPEDEYNALNTFYQVIEDRIISSSRNTHLLTFCGNLNTTLLASLYVAPNILYAEPNGVFGDGDRITVDRIGTTLRYSIKTGCGDCLSGCIYNRRWTIDADENGNLTLASFEDPNASCFVNCCLPQGACLKVPQRTCQRENGTEALLCIGDSNCDGFDDACRFAAPPPSDGDTQDDSLNPCTIHIKIDIKPDSNANSVTLGAKGVLPVAIFTTKIADGDVDNFDAIIVDRTSLTLAGAVPLPTGLDGLVGTMTDIDGDGDLDLLLHFPIFLLHLSKGYNLVVLDGQTVGGRPILGRGRILARELQPDHKIRRVEPAR